MPFPTLRPDSYGAANRLFSGGIDRFTGAMENYSTRIQDRANSNAVSQLLGVENTGNAQEYGNALSQIGLGYADASVVNDAKAKLLNPQLAYEKGMYGFQTDDLGNAYQFNKNDGSYDQVANSPYGAGMVNPKHVVMKPVTNRGPDGVEFTRQVPYNKMTGQPVGTGGQAVDVNEQVGNYLTETYGITSQDELRALPEEKLQAIENDVNQKFYSQGNAVTNPPMGGGVGAKYPTMDKATKEGADALGASMSLMDNIKVPSEGQSGPFDSRVDDVMSWLSIDTDDGVASRDFDAEIANLTTAFGTAQVKGVLSDKDTKFITNQMPDRRLSPAVNANRINSIKKKISESITRFNKANPYHKIDMPDTNTTNNGGSQYGAGTEIISF